MSIDPLRKPVYDDKERFERFLLLLPESDLSEFLGQLHNARYDDKYNVVINVYRLVIESPFMVFKNKTIQAQLEIFKRSFETLSLFVTKHLFRINPKVDLIALHPELKTSRDKEDQTLYQSYLVELIDLVSESDRLYKDFIIVAHDELSSDHLKNDKSAEKNKKKVSGISDERIKGQKIIRLDILEDKTELKQITVYINSVFENPQKFNRRKYWTSLYELAKNKQVSNDIGFFDYFNSSKANPLYFKYGYAVTKILRRESGDIFSNITIQLITQKKISHALKST